MIRDKEMASTHPRKSYTRIGFVFLFALAGISLWMAFRFYGLFGIPAAIVMGSISALAIIAMIFLVSRLRAVGEASLTTDFEEVFKYSGFAGVITRNGSPIMATDAYMDLCREFDRLDETEMIPPIDKLFEGGGKDTMAAIFRLHHLENPAEQAFENIEIFDTQGQLRKFKIENRRLAQGEMWQVTDMSQADFHLEAHLTQAPIGLFCVNQDGQVLTINHSLAGWLGYEKHQHPTHLSRIISDPAALLQSPRAQGRVVRTETRLITKKGKHIPTVMVASWREVGEHQYVSSVALHGHSSLGNTRSTPANVNSSTPLNGFANGQSSYDEESSAIAPFAILELDNSDLGSARIRNFNTAFSRMTGRSNWNNKVFSEIFSPGASELNFLKLNAEVCAPGTPFEAVLTGEQSLPVNIYIVDDRSANKCRVFLVDVSARKSLEDQLVQSQKMQAIGRLVAEIAHDFNNLLAAMRLYTDTLLGRHPIGDPSYPELQQINSNVNRAASLVKKLLAYSRKQTVRAVKLDVSETLSDIAVTLKQVLGERVSLDIVHGRNLPPIKVDKSQLDTVLMNLAVNARDAMKGQGDGRITIKSQSLSRNDITDAGLQNALSTMPSDEFVVISVADTGTGMTDEIKSKIFEPFFTTKGQGEGTGLGLSTVYGIVQQSGGHLAVDSKMGVGTTFTIYLPAYDGVDEEPDVLEPAPQKSAPRRPANLAGQGNILFVEDEASVRIIAAKTLRKRGYNVVEAGDGEEAYDLLEAGDTTFDLMISDVVMPGMDGPTLLKKGRSMLGDARIVFISGYAEEEFSDLLSEEPDVTFLPKPFSLIQLAEKVKAEIGGSE